jgi:preprotein translocase subunit SecD
MMIKEAINYMRGSYNKWLFPILVVVAAAIWVILPNNPGIHLGSIQRDIKTVRGLDLQGGMRVLLEADLPPDVNVTSEQIQTARDIVDNRVNGLGVYEPLIQVAGDRRIMVELPGISDTNQAIETIQETGLLEFIEISQEDLLNLPEGLALVTDFGQSEEIPSQGESETAPKIFHTVMTGAALKNAGAATSQTGKNYVVVFELTEEGTKLFADYTSSHVGDLLGIVLDKQLISAPRIQEKITQGQGSITGDFTIEEANKLAVQLRYGSLPIPLKVVESKTVGPTLGEDSLQKSMIAGLVGFFVVILYMALYYRMLGLIADIALIIYAIITFALFRLIPVTLTLPGIAGFILSIGVAVDANVLIFERMKEELRNGRTLNNAINLGFSRAWPSIRDSNISTLITCLILFWFGNTYGASIVKGFSITLALGVLVSLFTAITVTRTILHTALDRLNLSAHPRWFGT